MNPDFSLVAYLNERKALVDDALDDYLPGGQNDPSVIVQAIRYSLLAGGKRIRPILCLAAAEAIGGDAKAVLPAACALEMIHTYSLIHDDLPAMDNDDYRRGRPTSHKVFGEGIAILAGDALLTEAFRLLTNREGMPDMPPDRLLDVACDIAEAAGHRGMVGGQVQDIRAEGEDVGLETLYAIHRRKTGALLRVSIRAGAILAGAGEEALAGLSDYGGKIGLAFQIADDILNVEGDPLLLGKGTGSDAARRKVTFPALMGIEASRARAAELVMEAISSLSSFDDGAAPLRAIARYILERRS
ncbi:MAG: polyprenyl synthetase family protein [Syntrophales bacterium]|nr:polyprenyl synthetase family protein [Syntrophales bacterium]MDP3096600.1 polyprenyl synthetase family protein [Syntrophales bacterium]